MATKQFNAIDGYTVGATVSISVIDANGNISGNVITASANITAPQLISNVATGTAPLVVTSTTRVASLNVAQAGVADSINVAAGSGNNFIIFANAATGNVAELTSTGLTANLSNNSITATTFVGALSGAATSATTAGTVTTAAQPNITSVGTLTSLAVTGNTTSGNFVGSLANGNSNVNIPAANGNVNISAVGNANILVVTGTGANITGTANITGNANVGNIGATTAVFTTGNITTINSGLLQNGNSNVTITTNANVTINAVGGARITATSTGANVTGTLGVSGNANVGNIGAGTVVVSNRISQTGTVTDAAGYIQFSGQINSTQTGQQNMFSMQSQVSPQAGATLTALYGLLFLPTIVSSANNITTLNGVFSRADSLVSYTGTVQDVYTYSAGTPSWGSATLPSNVYQYTAFDATATSFVRGFWSRISTGANKWNFYASGTANNYMAGSLGIGTTTLTAPLTVTGNANISGNANVGNLGAEQILATANITSPQLLSNIATGTAPLVVTSTTQVANLNVATAGSATTAGTVTTNAQPNITSVGALTSLAVTGNVNFTGANVSLGNIANLRITGGSNGQVLTTNGSGTLSFTTPPLGNITIVGRT
jgi:hypothetical protein